MCASRIADPIGMSLSPYMCVLLPSCLMYKPVISELVKVDSGSAISYNAFF